jgi:hypothetical protein
MSVTKSNQNNLTSPDGNSLAVFVDINDNALKLKDINGNVEGFTTYLPPTPLTTGLLQLQGGVALSSTLTSVTDQNNTTSPLKLSTTGVQIESPLRITTSDASGFYLDAEDSATNNRFSIKRDPSSQEVTLDFASNPSGTTTLVGAIRTYRDGTNLSNAMSFIEDGSIGIGTNAPIGLLHLYKSAATTRMVMDGDAGQSKIITYRTGGLQRFGLYVNNTAESGSNAGSNFAIRAYNDAGTLLSTPLFIERSTGNVGIGTTAPISPLNVYNSSASNSSLVLVEQDTSATIGQINQYRKNGSVNLVSGAEIGRLSFGGYFNSTYSPFSQVCSAITGYYGGTGTDRVGGLRLVTWNGGGLTTRLQVAPDGKISIGTTGASAKVQIVGEGSTSATTSLLVQNSSGTQLAILNDAGQCIIGTGSPSTFRLEVTGTTRLNGNVTIDNNVTLVQSNSVLNCGIIKIGNGSLTANITTDFNKPISMFPTAAVESFRLFENGNLLIQHGGTFTDIPSSKCTINSTTQGFLPPRMTTAQKNAIATPAAGLMIYDTNLNKLCVYTGAGWETITSV